MIVKLDQDLCTGCGACADFCPMDVIRMKDEKAYITYPEDCQTCFLCEDACPLGAIYVDPNRARRAIHPIGVNINL